MYSRHHFLISLALGLVVVAAVPPPLSPVVVVGWAVVLGVFVDLDHFLVARYETGEWSALRRCVTDPRLAFVDQGDIFAEEDVHALQRLLTHHLVGLVLVPVTWGVTPYLGVVTALTLYAHVLSDLAWDVWRTDFGGE